MESSTFHTILSQYFPLSPEGPAWTLSIGASGMNNTTRYVTCAGERYVLRVYETHRDEDKVAYEHHVLDCLTRAPIPGLPTPYPVPTPDGRTVVRTPDGKLASLFLHRKGRNPVFETERDFREFGRAAGALSLAMAELRPEREPLYRPYYELCLPTPEVQRERLFAPLHLADSPVADLGEALEAAESGLARIHAALPALRALPHQLIHGDLNASNVLADEHNRIVALLDFEFVAWDLRVMELAVCLSEAVEQASGETAAGDASADAPSNVSADAPSNVSADAHSNASEDAPSKASADAPKDTSEDASMGMADAERRSLCRIRALVRGFLEKVPLTDEELSVLPDLLLLRRLDVFIHFLNRWRDGVDTAARVRRFLLEVLSQTQWLEQNRTRLFPTNPR